MILTAIYIRKSRQDKDNISHRLQVQREQLPALADSQGWQYSIYDDGHASAARGKTDDLKERARLEADIRAGKINRIICIELSRLSRDESLQDYVAWLHLCAEHGVKLCTLSRSLDPSQHSDWMLLLMEGGFSSVEMKVLKGRMKEGYDQAFRVGKYLGGTPPQPYIYDLKQKKPVINPTMLTKMQQLWKLAETVSAKKIAEKLGLPEIFVSRAITNDRLLFYQSKRILPTGEVIDCEWEACMDIEQVLRIREGRRGRKNSSGTRARYGAVLSNLGLLYCGYCGKTVKPWYNSKIRLDGTRNDYYGCQSKNDKRKCERARLISQKIFNDKVLTNLFNTLESLADIKEYWAYLQERQNPQQELTEIGKKEKQEQGRKQRLVTAISDGIIEFADAKAKMIEINERLELLQKERQNILKQISAAPDWNSIDLTREEFNTLDMDDQREIIKLAIEKITIYHGHAIITYPFPRNSNGDKTAQINLPYKV